MARKVNSSLLFALLVTLLATSVLSQSVSRPGRSLRAGRTLLDTDLEIEPDDIDEDLLEEASLAPTPAPEAAATVPAPAPAIDAPAPAPVALVRAPPPPSFESVTPSSGPTAAVVSGPPPPPPPYVNTIGSLVSYVNPSPGIAVPPLSAEALAAEANLTGWYLGLETINANRQYTSSTAQSLNCGTGYLNSHFQRYFAAIPTALWYDAALCGACINVTCVDTVCPTPFTTNGLFMIVDSCDECTGNNVVLSAAGIGEITSVNYDNNPSLQVAWEFASCSSLIEGGIKMLPNSRNSKYYVGLNFSNLNVLLSSVSISGLDMTYSSYGYWIIDTPGTPIDLSPPYVLRLTSRAGEVLSVRIPSLTPLDLGVNFTV